MRERLTREERLRVVAQLCPRGGRNRACDSREEAQRRLGELLGPTRADELRADHALIRAVDRYAAGELSLEELYRCRVLAYYQLFAPGGEEWERWGVVARVTPDSLAPPAEPDDLELDPAPSGPPWLLADRACQE